MTRRKWQGAPKRIGEYRILDRIAVSGIAELYVAQHRAGGPIVCIKRIPPSVLDDVDLVLRFDHEVELAMQLKHPNIVEVIDRGEHRGHYLVMERIDGPDLSTLLGETGPLEPALVAHLGTEMARALHYLHRTDPTTGRKPVFHADVSPQNILIANNGTVKLSDFGLARALRKTGAETITDTKGKPRYLSPEQWRGQPAGARSDLFSLGLVLWRALIGTHPYAEGRPMGPGLDDWIRDHVIANDRRSVADAAPSAPPPLQAAVDGLLQLPDERIATAEVLYHMLAPIEPIDGAASLAVRIADRAGGR